MADIVNLRRFRKARLRTQADTAADLNRAVFGRSKAGSEKAKAERDRATLRLDGHRLTASEADGGNTVDGVLPDA